MKHTHIYRGRHLWTVRLQCDVLGFSFTACTGTSCVAIRLPDVGTCQMQHCRSTSAVVTQSFVVPTAGQDGA